MAIKIASFLLQSRSRKTNLFYQKQNFFFFPKGNFLNLECILIFRVSRKKKNNEFYYNYLFIFNGLPKKFNIRFYVKISFFLHTLFNNVVLMYVKEKTSIERLDFFRH